MSSKSRLVILGTGWASFALLKNINKELYRVIVISPRNYFLFTPLLTSTTVGTVEFRSITEPIRNHVFRHANDFHLSSAKDIQFQNKSVVCESIVTSKINYEVNYDKLVIGVGALANTFGVPGVLEHSFFLKEIPDARAIRTRLIDNFETSLEPTLSDEERARLKHVVIVGGGPTGVEFGAELYDFCKEDLNRLYKDFGAPVRVTLVESKKILGAFDAKLQAYAERKLSTRENFSLKKAIVTEVRADSVVLDDGSVMPCGMVVWSTGVAPKELVKKMDVQKNRQGQILTDDHLRVLSDPLKESYAIGDCADIMDTPLPQTAQVAESQGRYLADQLNRMAKNKEHVAYHFKSMGMLAYIGGHRGLSDLPDFKLKGFTSWLFWRSAYLTKLGSWRLKMQVPFDWLKAFLFGRDTSRF